MNTDTIDESTVLCIDIGSHTQNALLAVPGENPENYVRCMLPSPSLLLERRIRGCTAAGQDVFLYGPPMGREFFRALTDHVAAGYRLAVHPDTAAFFFGPEAIFANKAYFPEGGDANLEEYCPFDYVPLETGDIDLEYWTYFCRMSGVSEPDLIMVSAQDQGINLTDGSHLGRMDLWRDYLFASEGRGIDPKSILYHAVPAHFCRLDAVQAETSGPVADSATASALGLLAINEVRTRSYRHGILLLALGNQHVRAFLVYEERIYGVYEQHTFGISVDRLLKDLEDFRLGWLPDEEVREAGGHGCVFLDLPAEAEGFRPAFVTGPYRHLLDGHGQMASTFDDTLFTGCFGLLYGAGYLPGDTSDPPEYKD